jgi:hypothetical protein
MVVKCRAEIIRISVALLATSHTITKTTQIGPKTHVSNTQHHASSNQHQGQPYVQDMSSCLQVMDEVLSTASLWMQVPSTMSTPNLHVAFRMPHSAECQDKKKAEDQLHWRQSGTWKGVRPRTFHCVVLFNINVLHVACLLLCKRGGL